MSRISYSFDESAVCAANRAAGRKPRIPLRKKLRSRRYLRGAMEAAGLFAFGYGSTSLVMHLAAGFFLIHRVSGLFPHLHL
ncbi:hypothetical protein LG047_10260 [Methylocystis sp. WRRC1]|uniref:hypothetical protein n=1 Tax=unclassified Methylocystis TaxID=2625913 RepID=UPI0001F87327|nr:MULTISPECIES: hypothetical protein [unclassified Methylocystis]MCC3245704.1 hypothetical protein [Methylocystis sp. WRRC1]